MSRTIQFENDARESANGNSVQGCRSGKAKTARLVACLLLLPEDSEPILQLLQKLAIRDPELCPDKVTAVTRETVPSTDMDSWLGHSEAAAYLGVSTSTLYHYSIATQRLYENPNVFSE